MSCQNQTRVYAPCRAAGCGTPTSFLGALLDRRITVQRQTVTKDAGGAANRDNWRKVASNVPALILPAGARLTNDYARRDMVVDYQITTTVDLEAVIGGEGVKLTDRIYDQNQTAYFYLVQGVQRTAHALNPFVSYVMDCQRLIYSA